MKKFDVEKYASVLQVVLNKLNTRKGEKIAWKEFTKTNKVSSSFGTALQRIGLVEKMGDGKCRSNTSVNYISRKNAVSIATVINDNDILSNLQNDVVLGTAKDAIAKLGILRLQDKAPKVKVVKPAQAMQPMQPMQPIQAAQPAQAPPPVVVAKATPLYLPDLSNYSTQALLTEIGTRIISK